MTWIIVIVIVAIIVIVAVRSASTNSPERQLAALKEWFDDYPQTKYEKIQKELEDEFGESYDKDKHWIHRNEKDFNERRNYKIVRHEENELWRMHTLTVLTSDKYSIDAKRSAVNAWTEFVSAEERLRDAIEIGYADSDEMERMGDYMRETRQSLIAVMAAFDFDLEKESKQIAVKVAKEYPVARRTPKKSIG